MNNKGFSKVDALFFAKLSKDAYLSVSEFDDAYFEDYDIHFFDNKGSQCYALWDDTDLIYVFRGTEPTEFADIKADLRFHKVQSDGIGKVHRGFKGALDVLWDDISYHHKKHIEGRNLYLSGHSLGAALATIAASRIGDENTIGYTYGSPRVGNTTFKKAFTPKFFRFRNNNDIVTRNPFEFVGFDHVGHLNYFDNKGNHRHGFSRFYMFKQYMIGMIGGFLRFEIDSFRDHSSSKYQELCEKNLK